MSPTKAQNRVRKEYGIGKTELHKRMSANRMTLTTLAYAAEWPSSWAGTFDAEMHEKMHYLVDALAADCIIATAYTEAERVERGEGEQAQLFVEPPALGE